MSVRAVSRICVASAGSRFERAVRPKRRARAYQCGNIIGDRLAASMCSTASAQRPHRDRAIPMIKASSPWKTMSL